MKLRLRTYRIGSPRSPGEGLRIGCVRFLPRGVKKEDYARLDYFDVWFPVVAPGADLLRDFKSEGLNEKSWARFKRRYIAGIRKNAEARGAVKLLAEVARKTPIAIGCYCKEERFCHRSILKELIEEAAREEV